AGEKGSDARRRPLAGREAYPPYVERPGRGRQRSRWPLIGSLRLALGDREGYVKRLRAPLQQHSDAIPGLETLRDALIIGQAPDPLAVDLADDVAPLQPCLGRGTVLLDPRDDHTFRGAQVELAGDLRRDRPRLEAEQALALATRLQLRGLFRGLADLDVQRLLAFVAPHLYGHALAGRGPRDDVLEILRDMDLLAVELQEDVAGREASPVGRTVLDDVGDEHALGLLEPEALGQLGRQRLDRHAEPPARDLAARHQLGVDAL